MVKRFVVISFFVIFLNICVPFSLSLTMFICLFDKKCPMKDSCRHLQYSVRCSDIFGVFTGLVQGLSTAF